MRAGSSHVVLVTVYARVPMTTFDPPVAVSERLATECGLSRDAALALAEEYVDFLSDQRAA